MIDGRLIPELISWEVGPTLILIPGFIAGIVLYILGYKMAGYITSGATFVLISLRLILASNKYLVMDLIEHDRYLLISTVRGMLCKWYYRQVICKVEHVDKFYINNSSGYDIYVKIRADIITDIAITNPVQQKEAMKKLQRMQNWWWKMEGYETNVEFDYGNKQPNAVAISTPLLQDAGRSHKDLHEFIIQITSRDIDKATMIKNAYELNPDVIIGKYEMLRSNVLINEENLIELLAEEANVVLEKK